MCILRTQRKTSTSWYLKKMRSQHRNSNFTFSFSLVHSEYRNMTAKKYIDQEPPYVNVMLQICVLQWVEIKTKNSGAMHHF